MEYGIDYILKLPTEDIKTYLESASIIDILAILENIKKRTEMDYASLNRLEKIEEQTKVNKKSLTDIEKRINIAEKTNASKSEIEAYWEQYRSYDTVIDELTSQKEQLIQNFNDKKQSIFTLAWNMILESPVSKLEDYRNHLITWLKNRIEAIETNKNHKEITTNTLLEERNYTKEDITAKAIELEIKTLEDQILNHELILNAETIAKIKSLRAKKDSLEHETFTYVCTEKIKTSLKLISNDITKLQMELSNLLKMDIDSLKELILSDYVQTKEEIKLANYVRIYRSYLENISKVALPLKADYRSICSDYATKLNSLENPKFEDETLNDLDSKLKESHNYIKTLEEYKKKQPSVQEESKFLYSTVRASGLFNLPFQKDKWLSYFGQYFESLINTIKPLEEKNSQYISLVSVYLKSKRVENELEEYRTDLRSMLDELYNQILSLYLKSNLYINVSIYDYRDTETLTKYIEYRNISIDKEIAEVKKNIEELNRKKSNILDFVNDTYAQIDNVIKLKLNSIFNGTYVKKEEVVEKPHHFFEDLSPLDEIYANTASSYTDFSEEMANPTLSSDTGAENNDFNPFFREDTPSDDNDIFMDSDSSEEEIVPSREKQLVSSPDETREVTTFNPDDIFGNSLSSDINTESESQENEGISSAKPSKEESSSSKKLVSDESSIDNDDIISFDEESKENNGKELAVEESDNNIFDENLSSIDRKAFKDLLEPKEVPSFNVDLKTEEDQNKTLKTEDKETKKTQRGIKVIKQEPVVAAKNTKVSRESKTKKVSTENSAPVITDAAEIKERIENSHGDKNKPKPLFNPASASEVTDEYNDTNAPIDLNAFLSGSLAPNNMENSSINIQSKETKPDKKLTLSQDDNVNLMDFLNQIENNDSKAA